MTREEAKKYFWTDTKEFGESVAKKFGSINYQKIFSGYYIGREIDEFIDKIYDDFEELIKPKTCEWCKHKPNDGECYYEPCGTCARFFYDHYEPKDNA